MRIKSYFHFPAFLLLSVLSILLISACNPEDDIIEDLGPELPDFTSNNISYVLREVDSSGISGLITINETIDGNLYFQVELSGLDSTQSYPIYLRKNTAIEGGAIWADLPFLPGKDGRIGVELSVLKDSTELSFSKLLELDAHISVSAGPMQRSTIVSHADIGGNELQGQFKSYPLESLTSHSISGEITFRRRKNDLVLAELSMENTPKGGNHPVFLHEKTALEQGERLFTFNPVNGSTGKSFSTIRDLKNGQALPYHKIEEFDGHIQVFLGGQNNQTKISRGDIGKNELSGEEKTYTIRPQTSQNIRGTLTLKKRRSGFTLAEINLENTNLGASLPVTIRTRTAIEQGQLLLSLNPVDGTSRRGLSSISHDSQGQPLPYESILSLDGHLRILNSTNTSSTVLAVADLGSNELTGRSRTYSLIEAEIGNIRGTMKVFERRGGHSLVEIALEGTSPNHQYPATIFSGTHQQGGTARILDLTALKPGTGTSFTTIRNDPEAGTNLSYSGLISVNGYLRVLQVTSTGSRVASKGNIGSNAQ